MRLSVVTFLRPGTEPRDRPLGRIVDYARRIERRGFPGIWVTDSLGRGRPTLDPLVALGVLSAATERVELGTAVLQVSLRNPIELAHRVQSVQAVSGGRLRLGVGSGSTQADFDLLGASQPPNGSPVCAPAPLAACSPPKQPLGIFSGGAKWAGSDRRGFWIGGHCSPPELP